MLNPYVIIAAGCIWLGSVVGGYLYGTAHERRAWEASTARLQAEASEIRLKAEARAREAENRAAEAAILIDGAHADAERKIAESRDAFAADLDRRLRNAARRSCGGNGVPSAPSGPSSAADPAAGSDPGLRGVDSGRLRAVRDAAMRLQGYAVACHSFTSGLPHKADIPD